MKRFLSVVIAPMLMVLMFSTSLIAMAETNTSGEGETTASVTVTLKTPLETITPEYSVEIVFDELKFEYTYAMKQVWNHETHTIMKEQDLEKSGWNKDTANIIITNNSNVGIKATVTSSDTDEKYCSLIDNSENILDPGDQKKVTLKMAESYGVSESAPNMEKTVAMVTVTLSKNLFS